MYWLLSSFTFSFSSFLFLLFVIHLLFSHQQFPRSFIHDLLVVWSVTISRWTRPIKCGGEIPILPHSQSTSPLWYLAFEWMRDILRRLCFTSEFLPERRANKRRIFNITVATALPCLILHTYKFGSSISKAVSLQIVLRNGNKP